MAVRQQRDFALDVVDGIDDEGGSLAVRVGRELDRRARLAEELVAAVEVRPGGDLLEASAETVHLGGADVGEGRNGVAVEGGEGHLVEVDETKVGAAGAGEGGGCVRAHAAAADHDDEGGAEFGEAGVSEEDAVSGQLLKDEVWVC